MISSELAVSSLFHLPRSLHISSMDEFFQSTTLAKRFLPSSDADAHETIDQSDEVENHSHLGKMVQMRYSGHGNIKTIH